MLVESRDFSANDGTDISADTAEDTGISIVGPVDSDVPSAAGVSLDAAGDAGV
ncbi:unannotated protein [freshwater metagenome]|uniref:Unannotated protein n=1 Tax=freshwater metagenome TaxID=449393 RepID=A0A6J6F2T2_9ZZZZ